MSGKRTHVVRRAFLAAGVVALCWIPGSTPAAVTPTTLIDQQVIKPNVLIVFDTSTSMMNAPGNKDVDSSEVGPDCDDGNKWCRSIGKVGRCFHAGTGSAGAGIRYDTTSCTTDAQCRVGFCKDGKTICITDAQCDPGEACTVYPNDVCIKTGSAATIKMCRVGQNICRNDGECTAVAGDTCGPASSRLVIAKRVVSGVVSNYYSIVNFGLMTFYQQNYFPYFEVSGSVTEHEIVRFLERDVLEAFGCWTKNGGPNPSCKINENTYNRRMSDDTRYRVKTGGDTFTMVDSKWCGLWCTLPAGTGYYMGSFYITTDPRAATVTTNRIIKDKYLGKTITEGGKKYVYYDVPQTIRNDGNIYGEHAVPKEARQPIQVGGNEDYCCATCGGRGDVVPFMSTSNDPTKAKEMAMQVIARMDKASFGGLMSEGFTPTGCALWNNSAEANTNNNAFSYMSTVKSQDTVTCRNNYVLLVTDGHPNYANEDVCDAAACSAASPSAAGCQCHSVLAAEKLKNAGVLVYVVGFSEATSNAYARAAANNIAKAGGTVKGYFAIREDELEQAIVNAIYDAAKGSYSTSPAVTSSGAQKAGSIEMGNLLLDTRVDFPGWTGNLIAYDTSGATPTLAWNARTVSFDPAPDAAGPDFWKKRRIWTSKGTTMVKFDVNATTGALTNKAALRELGLGSTDAEAELVARWLLGDPAMKNPAVLGAILNSTPIDVGPPGKSSLPGGTEFYNAHANRPYLTYVGSSDGMLHAFFTKAVTIGGVSYKAGQEAFAYIPQNMLQVATKLFAQGGQKADPADHIYGLANSAKVKSLCTANCSGSTGTPEWKTVLVMTYGWGGTEAFMLDITNPFTTNGVKTSTAPASLVWGTQYLSASSTSAYDNALGLTTSVPAFYYAKDSSKSDFRIIFGSYTLDEATGNTAKVLLNSSVQTGVIVDSQKIMPKDNCSQSFGLMSDVATAKNYTVSEEGQLLAGYFGDTWGNLYRYVPTADALMNTGDSGAVSTVESLGCNHPVHFAPTVVQLDRDRATNRPGEIYIVQVTNSALDLETKSFPASRMVIRRDLHKGGGVIQADTTFGSGGKIVLNAGVSSELCGITDSTGTTCTLAMPSTARPNATPMAIIKQDGSGFMLFSTWYKPAVDACNDGITYLAIHEWSASDGLKQRFAIDLASEPVTSAAIVGGKLLFATQSGVTDLSSKLPSKVKFTQTGGSGERLSRTGWTEMP